MADSDQDERAVPPDDQVERSVVAPSEQRGGTTPDAEEAREKGGWGAEAAEGVVPAELGGSDAPREMLPDDPQLGSSVLGATTGSSEPATEEGVDLSAGDEADATSDGGVNPPPEGVEPAVAEAPAASRDPERTS
jgi:hypothetical protein